MVISSPILPDLMGRVPFRLGTTYYILPDAILPNVRFLAPLLDEIELVLQINGKMRGALRVPANADRSAIEAAAGAAPEVARYGEGRVPRKVIVVPGRLVNVVV